MLQPTQEHMDITAGYTWLVSITFLALSHLQCTLHPLKFIQNHIKYYNCHFAGEKKRGSDRLSDLCQHIQLASFRVGPRIHSSQKGKSLGSGVKDFSNLNPAIANSVFLGYMYMYVHMDKGF